MGLSPSTAGGPSPSTSPRTPPPTPDWAAPSRTPGELQKEPSGVGGRGRERAGREGLWFEGRVLQLQWGMGGGDPPNTSWGQTHIWGLPTIRANRFADSRESLDSRESFQGFRTEPLSCESRFGALKICESQV